MQWFLHGNSCVNRLNSMTYEYSNVFVHEYVFTVYVMYKLFFDTQEKNFHHLFLLCILNIQPTDFQHFYCDCDFSNCGNTLHIIEMTAIRRDFSACVYKHFRFNDL